MNKNTTVRKEQQTLSSNELTSILRLGETIHFKILCSNKVFLAKNFLKIRKS